MKKFLLASLLISLMPIGAWAEGTGAADAATVAEYAENDIMDPLYNPPRKWYENWSIGFGVPLIPTGYNAFVGYVNKDASSFWGKRFGARLDFQIPSALSAKTTFADNGTGYDVDGNFDLLFVNKKFDDIADFDYVMFDSDDDGTEEALNLNGVKTKLSLKNQNIGGIIDFYPFGNTWFLGGIRLSGGYYTGTMNIDALMTMPNEIPTNGYRYTITGGDQIIGRIVAGSKVGAQFKWKYSGPYAGFGFDLGVFRGFKFYMDAGVVFAKAPKIKQSDIKMPVMTTCYQISGAPVCGNQATFDLNKKPDVEEWVKSVTAGLIDSKINGTVNQLDPATQDAIAQAIFSNPSATGADLAGYDFGLVATDLLDYIDGTTDAATAAPWIQEIFTAAGAGDAESQAIQDALNAVQNEWADDPATPTPGDGISSTIQSDIDDAWNDYQKGIDDLNDSLKDMKWMPVIKLGVMYRF